MSPAEQAAHDEAVPYEALAEIAQRQVELLAGDQPPPADALLRLLDARRELIASLPPVPPASAAPALARAKALHERSVTELTRHAAAARRTLGHVAQGRRASRGYGAISPRRSGMSWDG